MSDKEAQQREADALAQRFTGVNQAEFARINNVPGGKSMLNQHIKGRRPISMEAAICYANGFGVTLREISPSNADIMESAINRGIVGEQKLDLQIEQIRLLLERAGEDRDAAFLLATEALTRFVLKR